MKEKKRQDKMQRRQEKEEKKAREEVEKKEKELHLAVQIRAVLRIQRLFRGHRSRKRVLARLKRQREVKRLDCMDIKSFNYMDEMTDMSLCSIALIHSWRTRLRPL